MNSTIEILITETNKVVKNETPASISTSAPQAPPIAPPDSSLPQSQGTLPKSSKASNSIISTYTNSKLSLSNISPLSQTTTPVETNVSKISAAQPLPTAKNETSKTTASANQPEVPVPPSDPALPNLGNLEHHEVSPKSANAAKISGAPVPIESCLPVPQENESPVKENVPALPSAFAETEPKEMSPELSKAKNVDILPFAKPNLPLSSNDSRLPQTTDITEPSAVHSTPGTRLPQTNVSEVPPQTEKQQTSTTMKSTEPPIAKSANSTPPESRRDENLRMPSKPMQTLATNTVSSVAESEARKSLKLGKGHKFCPYMVNRPR